MSRRTRRWFRAICNPPNNGKVHVPAYFLSDQSVMEGSVALFYGFPSTSMLTKYAGTRGTRNSCTL